ERRLTQAFTPQRCRAVFGHGLRRMSEGEIRTMLLDRIAAAHIRERLLGLDDHRPDQELFEVAADDRAGLERGRGSERRRQRFRDQGVLLAPGARVQTRGWGGQRGWMIRDRDTGEVVAVRTRGRRLVAVGERVVNPFIHRVVRSADGLPLYVNYIIND